MPDQIMGQERREERPMVIHEQIYQYIRADKAAGGDLYKQLRHRLKHRKRLVGERIPVKGPGIDGRTPWRGDRP